MYCMWVEAWANRKPKSAFYFEIGYPYQIFGTLRHQNIYFIHQNRFNLQFMGGLIWFNNIGFQTVLYVGCSLTHSSVTSRPESCWTCYLAATAAKKHTSTTSVTNVVWCDGGLLHWDKILLWCEEWEDTSPLFTQPAACCLCLYRQNAPPVCKWTHAYVVSTATDADGLLLMDISNHLQITAWMVCPKDWIRSKKKKYLPAAWTKEYKGIPGANSCA